MATSSDESVESSNNDMSKAEAPKVVVSVARQPLAAPTKTIWLDRFLVHYNKFIASGANQDKGLKLLQWTLWLFSRIYPSKKESLQKSSLDISFARYILRFYGFPSTMEAVRNGTWEDPQSYLGRLLGKLMAWSMLGYYPLEHVAYVRWTSPKLLPYSSLNANRLSAYSCRFWLLYLLAELAQGTIRLRRMYNSRKELKAAAASEKDDDNKLATLEDSIRNQQLQMARSALFTFPCIHWALPKWDTDPWLSEDTCNGLMWIEAVVSMYQAVRGYRLTH
jgi:hypothetical protein